MLYFPLVIREFTVEEKTSQKLEERRKVQCVLMTRRLCVYDFAAP